MILKEVTFNQAVPLYVDNFLNFPVGGLVPAGYYDQTKAAWIASQNGRIIKILAINAGKAQLDIDGSGQAADATALTALGITPAEQSKLAATYSIDKSLWRVPIKHFSPWDCNWPFGPPVGSAPPQTNEPTTDPKDDDDCEAAGSIIEIQNQLLRERIPLAGTNFTLNYASDRVPGRSAGTTLDIALAGETLPVGVKKVKLRVNLAGQLKELEFDPQIKQSTLVPWDGKDAYGRSVSGSQTATVEIGYVYDAQYQTPVQQVQSFGRLSGVPLTGSRARRELTLWQKHQVQLRKLAPQINPINGWSLSNHHFYDFAGKTLYLGTGRRRSASCINPIIETIAGADTYKTWEIGALATETALSSVSAILSLPDGRFLIAAGSHIFQINNAGILEKFAGTGGGILSNGFSGDGGPALSAKFNGISDLALGPDGAIYLVDYWNYRIRKIDSKGIVTTVAGTGVKGYYGDEGPATAAQLKDVHGLTVTSDGSIYLVETSDNKVRKISPDGVITTIAGNGNKEHSGDGGPAHLAGLNYPMTISADQQNNLYISEKNRIRKISPDGIITTIAGTGVKGYSGDGGLATEAKIEVSFSSKIIFDQQGNLYFSNWSYHVVRCINTQGIITTVAGKGNYGFSGDTGPARAARLAYPGELALDQENRLYIYDGSNDRIRRMDASYPGFTTQEFVIPSASGSLLYYFAPDGRHLQTVNALTNQVIETFTYDNNFRLSQITDQFGNETTIERDALGNALAIIGAYDTRTNLLTNSMGYLTEIINLAGERITCSYTSQGLLTSLIDPRGGRHQFNYDLLGRLTKDTNPAGGEVTLTRQKLTNGYQVTKTVRVDSTTQTTAIYQRETLASGQTKFSVDNCCGNPTVTIYEQDGSRTTTAANGVVTKITEGPDPRFGMQAPLITQVEIKTPRGLTYQLQGSRQVTLADTENLLDLASQTDTTTLNGKTYTTFYDKATKEITTTSPAGRTSKTTLNANGQISGQELPGLTPIEFGYDSRGRLTTITEGDRVTTLSYNPAGYLAETTDPLNQVTSFTYDAVGRVIKQTLPSGQAILSQYDAAGNITGITPPSKPEHQFSYTPTNLTANYQPPALSGLTANTAYTYNLAGQLTRINRPDGQKLTYEYDSRGRLLELTLPQGKLSLAYDANTGNLQTIIAPDGNNLSYTYDGHLTTQTTTNGSLSGQVGVSYNNDFLVTSQQVNDNYGVNLSYDPDSLLTTIGEQSLTRNSSNGLLTGSSLAGFSDSLSYTSYGEVVGYQAFFNSSPLLATTYTRDKLGRIVTKTETINGQSHTYAYTYDAIGQLTKVTKDGAVTAQYIYDPNGNRLNYNGTNGIYDDQDRLISYDGNSYSYTANGELQRKTTTAGTTSYVYDVLGNLTKVTLPDNTQIEYLIDGQNRRVGKKVNGSLVQGFLYQDRLNPVAELDSQGKVVARFVYGTRSNVPDYMVKNGVTYCIVSDHLGSPRLVVDTTSGNVVQRMDYDEFGQVLNDTNPGFQPFGFAGGVYDKQTGLVRFGARDYDAEVGRWTAKDPILFNGGDTDLFAYCGNDPVNYLDRDGLEVYVGRTRIPGIYIANHTFILVTDGPINEDNINPRIYEAGPENGKLERKTYSDPKEVLKNPGEFKLQEIPVPCGKTLDNFQNGVINTANNYSNIPHPKYEGWIRTKKTDKRNSNSYIGSVLRANGSNWEPNYWAPGWDLDIQDLK